MIDITSLPERIKSIYSNMNPQEQYYLREILSELAATGTSKTYDEIWLNDYKEIPVDINTFIESEFYLGATNDRGKRVFPYWRNVFNDIFAEQNKYEECFFTGATRIGKTSSAITVGLYMLYWLQCLRDPQRYFHKKDISIFSVLFFNITKEMAAGVAFREFNDTLKGSPWFNQHGTFSKSDRNFYYIPEGGKISIDYGSDASHGLGKQVFVGFMDEMNFAKAGIKDINKAKKHMKDLYNTISARVKGTFRMNGEVYGKILAVSSKNSDNDFMETYRQDQIQAGAGDHMYVSDAPQWEVLPPETFKPEKFYIAVGDRHKRGFVVPDNQTFPEALDELKSQGYTIMTPPIDMRPEFVADFDIALRDLAGISVPGTLSFITQDQVSRCIGTRKNPFFTDVIQVGTDDNYSIEEFCHIELVDKHLMSLPTYLHLDLSLNTCNTGISANCISGRVDMKDSEGKIVSLPTFSHLFSVAIQAPRGSSIPYEKITTFIVWLKRQGMNITNHISRDQYQSEYMAQLLEAKGLGKVPKVSMDRTPEPYAALRAILSTQRIDLLDVSLLANELIHLQRDSVSGAINKPIGGCFTGDTLIRLVDGRSVSICDLLQEQANHKVNWVYTVNETTHKIEPKRIKRVFQTKLTKDLVRVTLDNGQSVLCTPDHRFMLRDGSFCEAQRLCSGTSLMPLYTKLSEKGLSGYRLYYEPSNNTWHYEHRQFCYDKTYTKGHVIHHCNYNKLDNCPTNLQKLSRSKHQTIHDRHTLDRSKIAASRKAWWAAIRGTTLESEYIEKIRVATIDSLKTQGKYKDLKGEQQERISAIEKLYDVVWNQLSASEKNRLGTLYTRRLHPEIIESVSKTLSIRHAEGKFKNAEQAISNRIWYTNGIDNVYIKHNEEPPEGYYRGRTFSESLLAACRSRKMSEEAKERMREHNRIDTSNRIWITDGAQDKYINKDAPIPEGFHRGRSKRKKNHKVCSVEYVHQPCRVYDLEIEDNHNFALDCGVFVHNSKDLADTMAGSLWNAMTQNPGTPVPAKSVISSIAKVNQPRSNGPTPFGYWGNYKKY